MESKVNHRMLPKKWEVQKEKENNNKWCECSIVIYEVENKDTGQKTHPKTDIVDPPRKGKRQSLLSKFGAWGMWV